MDFHNKGFRKLL